MDWNVLAHWLRNDEEIGTIGEAQVGMLPAYLALQSRHGYR